MLRRLGALCARLATACFELAALLLLLGVLLAASLGHAQEPRVRVRPYPADPDRNVPDVRDFQVDESTGLRVEKLGGTKIRLGLASPTPTVTPTATPTLSATPTVTPTPTPTVTPTFTPPVPAAHAATHETGGSDPIDTLDASVITSGVLSIARGANNNVLTARGPGEVNCTEDRGQGLKVYSDCIPIDITLAIPKADQYVVDAAGQDADTRFGDPADCGDPLNPCRTVTGEKGAFAKMKKAGRVGFEVCPNDRTTGCGRCSGTTKRCIGGSHAVCTLDSQCGHCSATLGQDCLADTDCPSTETCVTADTCVRPPCNEHTDCIGNGVCTGATCSGDSSEMCAGRCSVTTGQHCTWDAHCPQGEECFFRACSGDGSECLVDSDCPATETCDSPCADSTDSCSTTNPTAICGGDPCTTTQNGVGLKGVAAVLVGDGLFPEVLGPCDPDSLYCLSYFRCEAGSNDGGRCLVHASDCTADKTPHPCCTGNGTGEGCSVFDFCPSGGACSDASNVCDYQDPQTDCSADWPGHNVTIRGQTRQTTSLFTNYDATNSSADHTRGIVHDWSNMRHMAFERIQTANAGNEIATVGSRGGAQACSLVQTSTAWTGAGDQCRGASWTGQGNATLLYDDALFFPGPVSTSQASEYERGPGRVCSGDRDTPCTLDSDCAASQTCVARFCWHDGTIPCEDDSDCTPSGGAAGYCVANAKARYGLGAETIQSCDHIGVNETWFQGGTGGGPLVKFSEYAEGCDFNNGFRSTHFQVSPPAPATPLDDRCDTDGDGDGNLSATTCTVDAECDRCSTADTPCVADSDCPASETCAESADTCEPNRVIALQVDGGEVWLANVSIIGSYTTGSLTPADIDVDLRGDAALQMLGPAPYNPCRRRIRDTARIDYVDPGDSDHAGGNPYLGMLYCDPNNPQPGESFTGSPTHPDVGKRGVLVRSADGAGWGVVEANTGQGKTCSGAEGTACTADSDCVATQTCIDNAGQFCLLREVATGDCALLADDVPGFGLVDIKAGSGQRSAIRMVATCGVTCQGLGCSTSCAPNANGEILRWEEFNNTVAHGATGAVCGTTNTQTLLNKTLTAPIIGPTTFASLGTPTNGTVVYCSDCTAGSDPCTGSGNGAHAFRMNGAWTCVDQSGGSSLATVVQFTDDTDDTNENFNPGSDSDIWDGTHPNLTPAASGNDIKLDVCVRVAANDAADSLPNFRIVRTTGGTDPGCSDTSVATFGGCWLGGNSAECTSCYSVVDTLSTIDVVEYGLCLTGGGKDDGTIDHIRMVLQEVE